MMCICANLLAPTVRFNCRLKKKVSIYYIDIDAFSKRTPLENFFSGPTLNNSMNRQINHGKNLFHELEFVL